MELIYRDTKKPVKEGDKVTVAGRTAIVHYFTKPPKPGSQGKVTVRDGVDYREYYVSAIGAEWINREDRK